MLETHEIKVDLAYVAHKIRKMLIRKNQHNCVLSEDEVFELDAYANSIEEIGRLQSNLIDKINQIPVAEPMSIYDFDAGFADAIKKVKAIITETIGDNYVDGK